MREWNGTPAGQPHSFVAVAALLALAQVACRGDQERRAEFEALERSWIIAQQSRDSAALESLLAPEFHLIEGTEGAPLPRGQYLAAVLHTATQDTIDIHDLRTAYHGDSATVSSRFSCMVVRAGVPTAYYEFKTTDLWVHRDGRWLAASRAMVLSPN